MIVRVLLWIALSTGMFFGLMWLVKWTNFFSRERVGSILINASMFIVALILGLMTLVFISSIDKL